MQLLDVGALGGIDERCDGFSQTSVREVDKRCGSRGLPGGGVVQWPDSLVKKAGAGEE